MPNEGLLSQTLLKLEGTVVKLQALALVAAGMRELNLPVADNPDHPLTKQLRKMFLGVDVLTAELTGCVIELIKVQHDGELPEDLVEEHASFLATYEELKKDYFA